MQNKNIYIASDHAGFELKTKLLKNFPKINDLGTKTDESVDYPDFAHKLTKEVLKNKKNVGILICGTGVGMSVAANKFKDIRAGLVFNSEVAKLIREHNDANILVLPGKYMNIHEAKKCVDNFLSSSFKGGRHIRRLNKFIKK